MNDLPRFSKGFRGIEACKTKEQKKMGRLPYEKQYELAYQIYGFVRAAS